MYLKLLEIKGFKSFAERCRIELGPGLTAIVGPNGSGKSNIVEAVRWVLGEQNPRELRGVRMEDVIFAGSTKRKPIGLAEVTLTFDNADGTLPIEFSEVSFCRRLDRSGGSDYLLNRTSCRLKDITGVLAGSGLGRDAYSYLGQGRVDEVLSGKPEDRRLLLEEAAGIIRYRLRKSESGRFIDRTTQRLLRLKDLVAELEARIGPLEREALRAERFGDISAKIRELDLLLRVTALRSARYRQEERLRRNDGILSEITRREKDLAELLGTLEAARGDLDRIEGEVETGTNSLLNAIREEERLRGSVSRYNDRVATLQGRLELLQKEMAGVSHMPGGIDVLRQEVSDLESRAEAASAVCLGLSQKTRDLQRQLMEAASQAAGKQADLSAMAAETKVREREISQIRAESEGLSYQLQEVRDRISQVDLELEANEQELLECTKRQALLAREEEDLQKDVALKSQGVASLREEVGGIRARLNLLEEMEAGYDGYGPGVRAVLSGKARGKSPFDGVIGVVAQLIAVEDAYRRAIEIALGSAQEYVVVESGGVAQAVIEILKRDRSGRVTFLPLDEIRNRPLGEGDRALEDHPDAVAWAVDLVGFEERLRPIMDNVLGRVLVARDLPGARRLAARAGYRFCIVTLDGEVVHPGGAITGGAGKAKERGLIARVAEIKSLTAALDQANNRLTALQQELAAAQEAAREAGAAWQEVYEQERSLKQSAAQLRRESEQLKRRENEIVRRLSSSSEREADTRHALDRLYAKAEEWETALVDLRIREAALKEELRAAEEDVVRAEIERDDLRGIVQQKKAQLAAVEYQESSLKKKQAEIEGLHQEIIQAREALVRESTLLEEAEKEKERLEAFLNGLREERRGIQARCREKEDGVQDLRQRLDQLKQKIKQGEVEAARIQGDADAIARDILQVYGISEDQTVHLESRVPEGQLEEEKRRLKEELEAMGPVNQRAPEDLSHFRKLHGLRQAQLEDLQGACDGLTTFFSLMDGVAEGLLLDTYKAARNEFQAVFNRLFNGGQADLVFTDRDNPLTSGVEILAQPPGKKLQHLSLLSGGEKALTAIAFLIALLRVKPAPFCILDEFDAPLDESNVARVAQYIKEMSDADKGLGVQFLVITHQKGTMEVADRLLGVVMDEGVSRVVAVKLSGEKGNTHSAAANM